VRVLKKDSEDRLHSLTTLLRILARAEKAEARLRALATRLRELAPGPHDGSKDCEEYLDAVEKRVAELTESNEMACEAPPPGCDCPGCSIARATYGGRP
jgi:plasmid stabilization system protein ParE